MSVVGWGTRKRSGQHSEGPAKMTEGTRRKKKNTGANSRLDRRKGRKREAENLPEASYFFY